MWIVKVDRETEHEGTLTTQTPVDAEELEELEVLDAVQDQLNDLGFSGSASQDSSDEDLEPDFDADVSVSYDTDDSSPTDSSWETIHVSNSEILWKQPETAPATGAQITKISTFWQLITHLRLPLLDPQSSLVHGWQPKPKPRVLENILRSLDAISLNFRLVPLEVKGDSWLTSYSQLSEELTRDGEGRGLLSQQSISAAQLER
jgi:hypothetical protein